MHQGKQYLPDGCNCGFCGQSLIDTVNEATEMADGLDICTQCGCDATTGLHKSGVPMDELKAKQTQPFTGEKSITQL